MQELSTLIEQMGNELTDEYHVKFAELFAELNLYDDGNDGPIPLETWLGIAQAVADASGYRVVLQAAMFNHLRMTQILSTSSAIVR